MIKPGEAVDKQGHNEGYHHCKWQWDFEKRIWFFYEKNCDHRKQSSFTSLIFNYNIENVNLIHL